MFRRTILPITSSEIIKTGLKGRIEGQTVNEEVNIFLEGQIDSGFISEITIGGNVYKGFLVKMDANPIPPPANRDPTTSSMIIPSMQQKGIPGFDNLVYPSPLMSSAAFHPAPSFVPPPPPQTIALPPIEDESEKKDKKRKKEKRREKRDDSSEEEKKDKKKKKKKKDNEKEKEKEKRPDSKSSSSKSKTQSKSSSKPSASQTAPYPQASQISFPPWFDMSQIAGNPASPSPLGWTGQSLVSSLSTKCNSCQQILLYPSGEKTVRCPSCKAILDVEHAESSVLRPCMGCGTMLGNPTSAIKVLCPLCKTTMDWNQAGKASLQREKSGEKPIINLENDEDKSTSKSAEESAKSPVEEKKENGVDHKEEEKTKTEPTTPTEDKS